MVMNLFVFYHSFFCFFVFLNLLADKLENGTSGYSLLWRVRVCEVNGVSASSLS